MSLPAALSPPSLFSIPQSQSPFPTSRTSFLFHPFQISHTLLRASRRTSNFSQGVDNLVDDRRNWNRSISSDFDLIGGEDDEDDEEEDEDEEEDRSLDLLVRFVENVFRKVSRQARKAVRSVLPQSIPTKLVRFSVNGVLMLAFLWVLKAFLEGRCYGLAPSPRDVLRSNPLHKPSPFLVNSCEPILQSENFLKLVICTLGTAVFVSILIIRGVWIGILYLQDTHKYRLDQLDDDQHHAWTGAQTAS